MQIFFFGGCKQICGDSLQRYASPHIQGKRAAAQRNYHPLNSADYYEVYLQSGKETTLINGNVCFEELGDVIDEHIERGTDREEYNRFCEQQLKELIHGSCM